MAESTPAKEDFAQRSCRVIDEIFVFDNVIHVHDMSRKNLREDRSDSVYARDLMIRSPARGASRLLTNVDFARQMSIEEVYRMVFEDSPTDLAMVQVVPVFDWYNDWFAPVYLQHAMAEAYPDRVIFCGGVDPRFRGLQDALEQLEYQITELGARSVKFYNGHIEESWRCDDPEIAYPLYRKCLDLGVNVIQFHKGFPFGNQNLEALSPLDLQKAARDFPEMNFVLHHLAIPYFEETVNIASRFSNIHLALSGTLSTFALSPRLLEKRIGRLLMEVGVHKLLWGSEAALAGPPAPYLKHFMDLEISDDLQSGYGYPQITRDDKTKILGLNFAKLMDIDVAAKTRQLYPSIDA